MDTSCQNMANWHRGGGGDGRANGTVQPPRSRLPGIVAVLLVALLALFPPPLVAPALERMSFLMFDNFQRFEPRPV